MWTIILISVFSLNFLVDFNSIVYDISVRVSQRIMPSSPAKFRLCISIIFIYTYIFKHILLRVQVPFRFQNFLKSIFIKLGTKIYFLEKTM